jgi:heterokaryon incompatibility protein (HET)
MRLLDTKTLTFKEFFGELPSYAILSHTWNGHDEVLFKNMENGTANQKRGFDKIAKFCAQAFHDEFEYAWVDSCCIDKSSSAELSEAINSMFNWYRKSSVCYVYLEDIPSVCKEPFSTPGNAEAYSRWFSRGWVSDPLQEFPGKMLMSSTIDSTRINCSFSCQILYS